MMVDASVAVPAAAMATAVSCSVLMIVVMRSYRSQLAQRWMLNKKGKYHKCAIFTCHIATTNLMEKPLVVSEVVETPRQQLHLCKTNTQKLRLNFFIASKLNTQCNTGMKRDCCDGGRARRWRRLSFKAQQSRSSCRLSVQHAIAAPGELRPTRRVVHPIVLPVVLKGSFKIEVQLSRVRVKATELSVSGAQAVEEFSAVLEAKRSIGGIDNR